MLGQGFLGVVLEDVARGFAAESHEVAVLRQVGNAQVEGHSALGCAFKVARPAVAHILFGNHEAICALHHRLDASQGGRGEFVARNQNAVTLFRAAAHTSAKLVKLCQAEPLGILDDHHRSIGHVYAHLNHRGADQNLRAARGKLRHRCLLVGGQHFAVNLSHAIFGEGF